MQATSLPAHLKMEIERRPAAARRLGIMTAPSRPPGPTRQPPQVKECDLQVHAFEAKRRPVAAYRQGLLTKNTERNDVPTHDAQDTEAHRMEMERRPAAAKRQGHPGGVAPAAAPLDPRLLQRAAVPLRDTEYHLLEASRRPVAALRSGYAVVDAAVDTSMPAAAALAAAAAAPPLAFAATAAGAMEAERRPHAAARVAGGRQLDAAAARLVDSARQLEFVDSEYYNMEATRRPRATARLQKQRGTAGYVDLAAAAAAAAGDEDENKKNDETTMYTNNTVTVNVSDVNLEKNNHSTAATTTAAGIDSGANEGPNPFASLERMLESRLVSSDGRRSRGSSLRGAANYPGSVNKNMSRLGSSGNLQRCGSNASLSNHPNNTNVNTNVNKNYSNASNVVSRGGVACALEAASGDVVCRAEDSGDVVLSCHYDDLNDEFSALMKERRGGDLSSEASSLGAAH